jgi:hypothetical protein
MMRARITLCLGQSNGHSMLRLIVLVMLSIYLMNGFQLLSAQLLDVVGTEWGVQGIRDFNGDGRAMLAI